MMGFLGDMVKRLPDRVYLTPNSDSATSKTLSIHDLTPELKTVFFFCVRVISQRNIETIFMKKFNE